MRDLHTHTTASDGSLSPAQLVQLAKKSAIKTLAITDHDTMAGCLSVVEMAHALDIELVLGVEISCVHQLAGGYGKKDNVQKIIHVVALNVQDTNKMQQALQAVQHARANCGYAMTVKLCQLLSFDLADFWEKVLAKSEGNAYAIGRVHIAQVLFEMGAVKSIQQAFDKYLGDDKPAYVPIEALSMKNAIELIRDCGGVAVLAHPTRYRLSATRVRALIVDFVKMGGQACELPAVSEPMSIRKMIDKQIATYHLLASVGSDFHGKALPWRNLGQVAELGDGQVGVWRLWEHQKT